MSAIASILGDENRTSYGETLVLRLGNLSGPDLAYRSDDSRAIGRIEFDAEFLAMWRDDG